MRKKLPPSKVKRKKEWAYAVADKRVARLVQACRQLNKYAREFDGWAAKHEKYSIDHIIPRAQNGSDLYENLWICPYAWNVDNGMQERSNRVIWAIVKVVKESGRIHMTVPASVLEAERKSNEILLRELNLLR